MNRRTMMKTARLVCLSALVTMGSSSPGIAALGGSAGASSPASATAAAEPCRADDLACVEAIHRVQSSRLMLELEQLHVQHEKAKLADVVAKNEHAHATLWAQQVMSWLVLGLVFLIVGMGLMMSYQHMRFWFSRQTEGSNSFEVGKEGLKLNTPVIGLVIFFVSTYFFSVYIDKVYTIVALADASQGSRPVASATAPAPVPKP